MLLVEQKPLTQMIQLKSCRTKLINICTNTPWNLLLLKDIYGFCYLMLFREGNTFLNLDINWEEQIISGYSRVPQKLIRQWDKISCHILRIRAFILYLSNAKEGSMLHLLKAMTGEHWEKSLLKQLWGRDLQNKQHNVPPSSVPQSFFVGFCIWNFSHNSLYLQIGSPLHFPKVVQSKMAESILWKKV